MDAEKTTEDAVDRIVAQWAVARPDLDVSPMTVVGRIHRAAAALDVRLRATFAEYGLADGEFDVLATLRRSGPGAPYRLTPGELSDSMMVTSGAVTKRVDRLERAGLVSREVSAADGRGRVITLTEAGRALGDEALAAHVANEDALLDPLSGAERVRLADLLRKLLVGLEGW